MFLALSRLEGSVFRICPSVVPCEGDLLAFNDCSYRESAKWSLLARFLLGTLSAVSVMLEDVENFLLPAHVRLFRQVLPNITSRMPHEAAMFGTETKLGNVAQVFVQKRLISTTNDPDRVCWISR